MRRLGALALAGLWGCATLKPAPAPAPRPAPPKAVRGSPLLSPREAGFHATMTQQISLVKGSSRYDALGVVEISSSVFTVVGMGPLGNRLVALSWDGVAVTKELDASVPRMLPVEDILRQTQLVYWPVEALRPALLPGWELNLQPGRRELLDHGKVTIAITYLGDRFTDPIEVEDRAVGYKIIIKTLELSNE